MKSNDARTRPHCGAITPARQRRNRDKQVTGSMACRAFAEKSSHADNILSDSGTVALADNEPDASSSRRQFPRPRAARRNAPPYCPSAEELESCARLILEREHLPISELPRCRYEAALQLWAARGEEDEV
jgi:hypothetical protein